jgi:hypothetical protein
VLGLWQVQVRVLEVGLLLLLLPEPLVLLVKVLWPSLMVP